MRWVQAIVLCQRGRRRARARRAEAAQHHRLRGRRPAPRVGECRPIRPRSPESAPRACTSPTAMPCFRRRRCRMRRRLRRGTIPATRASSPTISSPAIRFSTPAISASARGTMVPDVEDPLVLGGHQRSFRRQLSSRGFVARATRDRTATTRQRSARPGPAALRIWPSCCRSRRVARSGHDHPRERNGHAAGRAPERSTVALLAAAGLPPAPPPRNQPPAQQTPGATTANVEHQQWFADATTKAILPHSRRAPTVCAGVLVGRSRSDAARAGRQPELSSRPVSTVRRRRRPFGTPTGISGRFSTFSTRIRISATTRMSSSRPTTGFRR